MGRGIKKISVGSFDFIKGSAICIIILGHIAVDFDLSRLTCFAPLLAVLGLLKTPLIPLFFIISGYAYIAGSRKAILEKTARIILLPYIIVAIFFTILQPISMYIQTHSAEQAVNRCISVALAFLLGIPIPGKILFGYKLSHCAIVWFLLALFWAYNLLNLILGMKRIKVQVVGILSCMVLGYVLFLIDFTYFCIPHGLIASGFFYVGYLLKKSKFLERGLLANWMYFVWILIAVLYANWGEFDLCYGKFRVFPVDCIGVMILALLLLVFGIYIGNFEWRIFDLINSVGIHSFWVLCIHSIEQKCIPWNRFIQMTEKWPNLGFVFALVIKTAIISVCCKLLKSINKWNYRKRKKAYAREKLCSGDD